MITSSQPANTSSPAYLHGLVYDESSFLSRCVLCGMDFDQIIVNSNLYNIYDNGFTDTVQGMPLRAAIRCIRFLSASRPNSLRSDSGLGGGSLPAPHYAVLLSIPRLVSVILLSVNVMRKIADMIYRTFPDVFS